MFKLKQSLTLVLILALAFCATPVFAQARKGVQVSAPIETTTDAVLPADSWLYGAKIYADASSSWMAIYEDLTVVSDGTMLQDDTSRIDEIGEATQYDSQVVWYDKPIFSSVGFSVVMTTGVGFLYYGPPPS